MWTHHQYREEHRLAHLSASFSGVHTQRVPILTQFLSTCHYVFNFTDTDDVGI